jgi:hypothetical protein
MGVSVRWTLALGALVFWARPVAACGGGSVVSRVTVTTETDRPVVADSQRILISTRRNITDIVVQIGVPETTADYGVLIPVPAEPTIDSAPVAASDFDQLDAVTAPTIVTTTTVTEYSSTGSGPTGGGCGCFAGSSKGGAGDTPLREDDAGSSMSTRVTVGTPTNIGPVTAVKLSATDASALNAWLGDNGFVIPEERLELLARYVGPDRYFIAIKRNDAAVTNLESSIGVHYRLPGDYRRLSLGFARLGAAPSVAFTVFAAGEQRLGPSLPFQTLTLRDLDATLLRSGSYSEAVKAAVKAEGSKAFVLESESSPNLASNGLMQHIEPAATILRLSTIVDAEDLSEDAAFYAPYDAPVEAERTVMRAPPPLHYANAGWVSLVLAGRALRRRARRRQPEQAGGPAVS